MPLDLTEVMAWCHQALVIMIWPCIIDHATMDPQSSNPISIKFFTCRLSGFWVVLVPIRIVSSSPETWPAVTHIMSVHVRVPSTQFLIRSTAHNFCLLVSYENNAHTLYMRQVFLGHACKPHSHSKHIIVKISHSRWLKLETNHPLYLVYIIRVYQVMHQSYIGVGATKDPFDFPLGTCVIVQACLWGPLNHIFDKVPCSWAAATPANFERTWYPAGNGYFEKC